MRPDRSADLHWWLTRVGIYFVAWTFADVLAYWIRFRQPLPQGSLALWVATGAWKLGLLVWFGLTFLGYWSRADFSRALVAIDIILSGVALALTSIALQRVHPDVALPPRPDLIT